jgi:hypothetical protein
MTEEEFRALLKLRDEQFELVVESQVVWSVMLVGPQGQTNMSLWASSTDKKIALDQLAEKFFGDKSADS